MILGLVTHDRGVLEEASFQMLTQGQQTAERMGLPFAAVLVGEKARPQVEELRARGVSRAILLLHPGLEEYAPVAWARALSQLGEDKGAQVVMAAGTERGNEVLAHLAARADLPMASNCSEVRPGDPFEVTRLRWGSSLLEEAHLLGSPKVLTVALDVVAPAEATAPPELEVEEFSPTLDEADLEVRLLRREAAERAESSLKTAPVVVGGGRGVGSTEGYAVLEGLAELIGGAVGGTRIATNNGWRPHSDQIGLTGTRIAPELYIACGISGAIQHLVGCKGAKQILVINKDPEAAFFSKADYGIVGDLHEVVPAIIEAIKAR